MISQLSLWRSTLQMKTASFVIVALALISFSARAEPEQKVQFWMFDIKGESSYSLNVNLSRGESALDDFDIVYRVRVCDPNTGFFCIVAGGTSLVFSIPTKNTRREGYKWHFAGREFQIEKIVSDEHGENRIFRVISSLTDEYSESLNGYHRAPEKLNAVFWYHEVRGLVQFFVEGETKSGKNFSRSLALAEESFLLETVSNIVPVASIIGTKDSKIVFNSESGYQLLANAGLWK